MNTANLQMNIGLLNKLICVFLVGCVCVMVLYKLNPEELSSDYGRYEKPKYTGADELRERLQRGIFDLKLLKYFSSYTEFLKQPKYGCTSSTKMVILVNSACANSLQRDTIRTTWGGQARTMNIPVLFFLGQCPESREEIEKSSDIVQADFVDTYFNNTLKTLTRYRWFTEKCSHCRYAIMADDDAILIVDQLHEYLDADIGAAIIGPFYRSGTYVIRDKTSKRYVPKWVWPSWRYTEHLGGGTYVVNGSIMPGMYRAGLVTKFFTLDDFLFTGLVADMIGAQRIQDWRFPRRKYTTIRCGRHSIIGSADFTPTEIKEYWARRTQMCK